MNHGSHEREPNERAPILVALKGDKLGHQIRESGQSFPLSSIINEDEEFYGGDGGCVYLETAQGNLYKLDYLDGVAQIINTNESRIKGYIVTDELPPEILKQEKLTIGESFAYRAHREYGDQDRTTAKITKIVATTNRQYNHNDLMATTSGKSDSIIHDYDRKLSFKPMPFPK